MGNREFIPKRSPEKVRLPEKPLWTTSQIQEEIIKCLDVEEGNNVLDITSGTGFATTITALRKKAEIIGIEFDKSTLEFSKNLAKLLKLAAEDKETAQNLAKITEKLGPSEELLENIKKLPDLSADEKEKTLASFMDQWVGWDLYKNLYLEMKELDSKIDKKLEKISLPKNLALIHGDALNLPIPSNSVDKILNSGFLEILPTDREREKAVREMLRVSKDGARVVIFSGYKLTPSLIIRAAEKEGVSVRMFSVPIAPDLKADTFVFEVRKKTVKSNR